MGNMRKNLIKIGGVFPKICLRTDTHTDTGVRTQGQMGSADPPGKMDEKLKSENMQKEQFSMFMLYFESNQGMQV